MNEATPIMKTEFEPGKTYRMRSGTTADVLSVDDDPHWPISVLHEDAQTCWHRSGGEFDSYGESSWDLIPNVNTAKDWLTRNAAFGQKGGE